MESQYITFEEVRKNKIKSILLVAALIAIIILISYLIGYINNDIYSGIYIGILVCVIVIPMQILTAKFAIIHMTRGQKADSSDEKQQRLISIVEGLAISAGLKRVPDVYIVPSVIPNAFASGMSEKDAFIGVTQGLLDRLNDTELTGVIGHEISHIVHRDIMLSELTVSLVSIILILSGFLTSNFLRKTNTRRTAGQGNTGIAVLIIVIAAIIIRPIALLIANLIQMAISRKREFAADAYSVRLCGYSEGLASALEKISNIRSYDEEQIHSLGGKQLRSMYIHFPSSNISNLFSTHPPIEERIKILRNMY